LGNLEEIATFLDTNGLPKLNQENINNLNRSLVSNEIIVVMVSQEKRTQNQMNSLLISTRPLKYTIKCKRKECYQTNSMKSVSP
jgi:hypothetical protein